MNGESGRARVAVPERDTVLSGRYRLLHLVGAGGMGSVWEAEDQVLQRRVAVKLVHDAQLGDPVAAARFEREAQTAARLSHPHLAMVYDYGDSDDGVYLVMELLEGETLAHRLRAGALPAAEAARVASETAEALAAAHALGVVHRDVKPANLMLTPHGVKVMDFGIASGIGAPLTATGLIIGTAAYLAPERLQGRVATPAADVYALGAVLFEALAGRPAFEGDTPAEVALGHVHRDVPDVALVDPTIPPAVAAACRDALAKDPRARPSAAALAARLRAAAEAAPELEATATVPVARATAVGVAPDLTPPAPPPRRSDRRRLALLGVLSLAVVAMVALILFGLSRQDDQQDPTVSRSQPTTEVTPTTAPAAATEVATTAPTVAPTTAPTAPAPTTPPTSVALAAPGDPADAALNYLAVLDAGDLEAAWALTSPEFQASQDRASWEAFWSGFDRIEVTGEPKVRGHSGSVEVPVSFDGRTERYRMTLVEGPSGWLVDGPVGR